MLKFTFWKVSLKGKAFTFIGVPLMAVIVMVAVIIMAVAVAGVAVAKAAIIVAPGKGSGKNLKKSSPWKKGGFFLGFLIRKGV